MRKISAKTSSTFEGGIDVAPVAEITMDGASVTGPVYIQPGLADYTVILSMGYGRTKTGRVGRGAGFNVFPLSNSNSQACATGANIRLTGDSFNLANTQRHWSMEGRAIIREANVEDYSKHPDFTQKLGMESHSPSIYGAAEGKSLQFKSANQPRGGSAYEMPKFGGPQQWGMTIDLNTCIGCNACVQACTECDTHKGQSMIQLDFIDLARSPQTVPVVCMHCDSPTCAEVCPADAIKRTADGIVQTAR